MPTIQKITPFLSFDDQAEEAATFYVGIFHNSRITRVSRSGEALAKAQGHAPDRVLTVDFEIEGQPFVALNGGPSGFNQAVSFVIQCETQKEIDYYWNRLTSEGGSEVACGWLKDQYGLSWQVTPAMLMELLSDPDAAAKDRTMEAMMKMVKLDIAALQRAHAGEA